MHRSTSTYSAAISRFVSTGRGSKRERTSSAQTTGRNVRFAATSFRCLAIPTAAARRSMSNFEVSTDKSRYRLVAGGVKKGQPVWTDRDYAISNVGEPLRGLDMIMVCNVDEKVYTNEHFRITIDKPLDIYMAWQWHPNRHTTEILHQEFDKTDIRRTIDGTSHHVSIQHSPGISVAKTGGNKLGRDSFTKQRRVAGSRCFLRSGHSRCSVCRRLLM